MPASLVYKRVHGGAILAFGVLWVAAWRYGWLESVVFVSHVSMAALVYAAWSAWQSTRTEVKQDLTAGPDGPTQTTGGTA